MKKILKSLVLVLGVALAVSVFAISASAIGNGYTLAIDFGGVLTETSVSELPSYSVGEYVEYKSGDFRASYRISAVSDTGNTLTVTLDTEDVRYYAIKASSGDITYVTKAIVGEGDLGEKFRVDMNALATGSTVKLLSDIFVDTGSVTVSAKTVYLDLNGFNLIFTNKTCTRGTAFSVKISNFYLYSSRTDGTLFHVSPQASYEETTDITTPLKPASHAVFSLGESSKINLGAYGDASGDNLSIYAYRIADTPIVIDGGGGTMTTLSSNVSLGEGEKQNITRNLYVTRCNVTVQNVVHNIYNEPGETGHTYSGFLYTGNAYNVEFNNCVVQSRVRCVGGTYDIGVYDAVDVRFINCTQSNFYNEGTDVPSTNKTWYVMGSNFCKNITYDGCMLTRFDAHCGVYNATIKNSTISVLTLTGGGHFYMENTTVVAVKDTKAGFIELREDYGSTWRGTIELKDCTYVNAYSTTNDTLALIRAVWVNHDFGYQTYLPNIIIDNLMLESDLSTIQNIEIFCLSNGAFLDNAVDGGTPDYEEGLSSEDYRQETLYHTNGTTKPNVNPYVAPDFILIKNDFAKKNYVAPTHVVFSETSFRELPVFDDIDTPIIPYP